MNNTYITYAALNTPLGAEVDSNWSALLRGKSGLSLYPSSGIQGEDLYLSLFENAAEKDRYNQILAAGLKAILQDFKQIDWTNERIGFVVSSTKGILADLATNCFQSTRDILLQLTGNKNTPIILSNACISGVSAINIAANAVKAKVYDTVLVIGLDIIWDFVKFGFQSLHAMSNQPVRPFDIQRDGVNLGEAFAAVIVSNEIVNSSTARYLSGTSSNDANHISGPSRTGEGLVRSVQQTVGRTQLNIQEIDFISGHGTGTIFNDEMEAIAFNRLELQDKPLHSLKGYFGHSLGAAGVLETVIALKMMEEQIVIPCIGFAVSGTSQSFNMCTELQTFPLNTILKTASGFGGGNASLIFQKI